MPLYEYTCTSCNASEERLCSFSAPAQHDCPKCGKTGGMRRQISAPSISFSGGGWYAQGYSQQPPCKDAKSAEKDSPKAAPSGDSSGSSGNSCCASCPMANGAGKKTS